MSLQGEAAKLFKPITAEAAKKAEEIGKVTAALERLPAQIATEADFNPIATLFGEDSASARKALPAPAPPPTYPTIVVNADRDLDVETIKRYCFKPPSELDPTNAESINRLIDGINRVNTYRLGLAKQKAKTGEEREAIERDIEALRAYRLRIRLLAEGYKLTERKGSGLKMTGNRFGDLTVDPVALEAGRLRAFDQGGSLALEAPADESLHSLLTKRFVETKQYTPQAVETFKKLVELAGLPVHGRESKKHELIHASGSVQYYNDPEALVERLQLLMTSKQAGNTGLDNEISAILDEVMRTGAIPKDLAVQLNKSLLSA